MSDIVSNHDDDDLTTTQEYLIAGAVILFFGWLYWFLNQDVNFDDEMTAVSAPPAIGAESFYAKAAAPVAAPVVKEPDARKPEPQAVANVAAAATDGKMVVGSAPPLQVAANADTQQQMPVEQMTPQPAPEETQPSVAESVPPEAEAAAAAAAAGQAVGSAPPDSATVPQQEAAPEQVVAAIPVYTLPDGTEVEVSSSGFEGEFEQAIVNDKFNTPIIFDGIYFDSGSTAISAESGKQIRATAALLNKYPDTIILIRGHTDKTGIPSANSQLSLMRANELGLALVNLGIDRERIRIMGMGDVEPIASNATESGRRQNRRIDISILD